MINKTNKQPGDILICKSIHLLVLSLASFFLTTPVSASTNSMTTESFYPQPYARYDHLHFMIDPSFDRTSACPKLGTLKADISKDILFCSDDNGTWSKIGFDGVWFKDDTGTYIYPTKTEDSANIRVGIGTSTPAIKLTLSHPTNVTYGDIVSFIDSTNPAVTPLPYQDSLFLTLPHLDNPTVGNADARFFWYPKKSALRAGAISASPYTQWDDANVGKYSLAFGLDNKASGESSLIAGGKNNIASQKYSAVLGGQSNQIDTSSAQGSVIIAGDSNNIQNGSSATSFIGVGTSNIIYANNNSAVIFVGTNNKIGQTNAASYSFIGAGQNNTINAPRSVIGGGNTNTITSKGWGSVILAGQQNSIDTQLSFVGGGYHNQISGTGYYSLADTDVNKLKYAAFNAILGGYNNLVQNGRHLFVGGGLANQAAGTYIAPTGATDDEYTTGNYNAVGGGANNQAGDATPSPNTDQYAVVSGGASNRALAYQSYIGGGSNNEVRILVGTILGGSGNIIETGQAFGNYSVIFGGNTNRITGIASALLGGQNMTIHSNYSAAFGRKTSLSAAAVNSFVFSYNDGAADVSITRPNAFIVSSIVGGVQRMKVGIGTTTPDPDKDGVIGNGDATDPGLHIFASGGLAAIRINNGSFIIASSPVVGGVNFLNRTNGASPYQLGYGLDLAESYETSEDVEAGDLVVIDEANPSKLKKSVTSYDTKSVGVVSSAPAVLFEGSQLQLSPDASKFMKGKKPPVAMAGRVICKVTLENGPIEEGDLLTSSSTPGHVMKANDPEKSFGTVVGRALESFHGNKGETAGAILMMVTRQ